jgi:alpha-galactosidase
VLQFEHEGVDLYPRLAERIAADPEGLGRKVRVEMYKRLGYFPTESSEHSSEYVPWFLHFDEAIERFRIPVDAYISWSEENLQEYEEIKRTLEAGRGFEIEPTQELASLAIHSLETGEPRVLYGNVKNEGLISNLPATACIEVPCLVDRGGFRPTRIGEMPPQLAALNQTFLNVSELTVRAALDEDREHIYHAAMLDPNCAATLSLDEIVALCDELIEAHGELMPAWLRS